MKAFFYSNMDHLISISQQGHNTDNTAQQPFLTFQDFVMIYMNNIPTVIDQAESLGS